MEGCRLKFLNDDATNVMNVYFVKACFLVNQEMEMIEVEIE
jgi:hypothetical protein